MGKIKEGIRLFLKQLKLEIKKIGIFRLIEFGLIWLACIICVGTFAYAAGVFFLWWSFMVVVLNMLPDQLITIKFQTNFQVYTLLISVFFWMTYQSSKKIIKICFDYTKEL